jgi:hypothetical protein
LKLGTLDRRLPLCGLPIRAPLLSTLIGRSVTHEGNRESPSRPSQGHDNPLSTSHQTRESAVSVQ